MFGPWVFEAGFFSSAASSVLARLLFFSVVLVACLLPVLAMPCPGVAWSCLVLSGPVWSFILFCCLLWSALVLSCLGLSDLMSLCLVLRCVVWSSLLLPGVVVC